MQSLPLFLGPPIFSRDLYSYAAHGELRHSGHDPGAVTPAALPTGSPFDVGVASALRPVVGWKHDADFLFVQVSYSLDRLLAWREQNDLAIPVYAGVMVLASAAMADRIATQIPGLDIPAALRDELTRDRDAGVRAACRLVDEIRASGAFDGVHLVPVSRYRQVALELEAAARR